MYDTHCSDVGFREVLAGTYIELRTHSQACSEQLNWPGNEIVIGFVLCVPR